MKSARILIRLSLVFCVVAMVTMPLSSSSAASTQDKKGPIVIGIDTELTGIMAETSNSVKIGYDFYLQEISNKVAGRDIKVIAYDNKTDVKLAIEVAQKLVEKDKVHILCFGTNSSGAIPVRMYADKQKVPMVVIGMAGAEQITLPPSKYVFRLTNSDGQGERPMGRYAYEKLGYKRVAVMGPDYSGSTGKLWAFAQEFMKSGGQVTQTILWPLGEMDFSPFLAQLKPDTDAIFPFMPGDISINRFLSSYFGMGLDKKGIKICAHWVMTEDYMALKAFGEKMVGIVSVSPYAISFDSPENKRLTGRYYAKYGKKQLMNPDVATGYDSMKFLCTALQAIKGNVEDTEAFLKAMHTTTIKGTYSSALSVDENGNVIRDYLIRQVQKRDGVVKNVVIDVIPQTHQPPLGYTVMPGKGK